MNIKELGENLFEVRATRWLMWNPWKKLIEALLQIQSRGKTITSVYRESDTLYLVCTR